MTTANVEVTNVEVTEKPFSITGTVKVSDDAFDASREAFVSAAKIEASRIAETLVDEALVEYDRRNA